MSETDDVVSDVHGGVAWLVDEGALVQSSEHLEAEEAQGQHKLGRRSPLSSLTTADNVKRQLDLLRDLNINTDYQRSGPSLTLISVV